MTQTERARAFAALHVPGDPVILYNIWDAGGASAVADAGARAIATASWAVAAAHGFADGEAIPLDLVLQIESRDFARHAFDQIHEREDRVCGAAGQFVARGGAGRAPHRAGVGAGV